MPERGQCNDGKELSETPGGRLVKLARHLAEEAHRGQKRKTGGEYIEHPCRVAAMMPTPTLKACALLHDVMEFDAPHAFTKEDLRKAKVPERVIEVVDRMTRGHEESYLDYIMRIAENPAAIAVKLGDLADNLSDLKPGQLREKYLMAQFILRTIRPNSGKFLRAWAAANNSEALCMDGPEYDVAIAGMCHQFGRPSVVAYDLNKVIEIIMRDGCTYEEAYEFWEFNQVGAWLGDTTPVFITPVPAGLQEDPGEEPEE